MLTGKGGTGSAVPATDIGLDPKCIVKRTPVMVGQVARVSTWQYDVDIDYIKSIGGVAKCFNAKTRSGTPDVGAYRAGAVEDRRGNPVCCGGLRLLSHRDAGFEPNRRRALRLSVRVYERLDR